ncbi:hypothetical protein CDAR_122501 [Caerostris darwini]|uniref:Uncharacterized protein n=1 Tax=Caerostris darwini TaxID=1538125 RepID=A0AAV4MAH0_9ARAC|nr:hypothetical protein CDAR_122501 [Caerostris darwini]
MRRERDIKQNKQKKSGRRGPGTMGLGRGIEYWEGTAGLCTAVQVWWMGIVGQVEKHLYLRGRNHLFRGAPFQNFHYCDAFHSEDREVIAFARIHQIIIKYNLERLWDPEYEVRFRI